MVMKGESKEEHEETRGGTRVSERRYGRFHRTIPLPEGADAGQARARFDNGVLEISVPVQESAGRRRQMPIEHK